MYYFSYTGRHRRGVALLISSRIAFEQTFEHKDKDGRFVLVKGTIDGNMFTLVNVYTPPGSDFIFYTKVIDC